MSEKKVNRDWEVLPDNVILDLTTKEEVENPTGEWTAEERERLRYGENIIDQLKFELARLGYVRLPFDKALDLEDMRDKDELRALDLEDIQDKEYKLRYHGRASNWKLDVADSVRIFDTWGCKEEPMIWLDTNKDTEYRVRTRKNAIEFCKEKGYSGEVIETREYLRQINTEWIESHLETRESKRGKNPNSLANLKNQKSKKDSQND